MVLSSSKLSTHFRGFNAVSRSANLPRSLFVRPLPFTLPLCVAACLTLVAPVRAQQTAATQQPANSLLDGRGTWDFGAFLGGGTGAGKSSNTQFLFAGGRAGRVLTPDLFSSTPIRGNLEYGIEIMPVYTVFTLSVAVYGASIKPFLVQWNFTKPTRRG